MESHLGEVSRRSAFHRLGIEPRGRTDDSHQRRPREQDWKLCGEDPAARANAVCAGSAAGLAAAFSSPLAGVTLVLQEIAGGRTENFAGRFACWPPRSLPASFFALSKGAPSLPVGNDLPLSWRVLWMSPVVAVVAGSAGGLQYLTLAFGKRAGNPLCRSAQARRRNPGWRVLSHFLAFSLTGGWGAFGLGRRGSGGGAERKRCVDGCLVAPGRQTRRDSRLLPGRADAAAESLPRCCSSAEWPGPWSAG